MIRAFLLFMCVTFSVIAQTPEETSLPTKFSAIFKATEPPVIDGNLKEWKLASAIFVSDPGTQPTDDCSGVFYIMWDEKNLYFAAKVLNE